MNPVSAPEQPSKQELRDQKKRDRHILNLLKLGLQPLMSVIKQSHKKFRTPLVEDSQIEYLFDEQNPARLGTDLPEEQRQQLQYRPFELAKDNKGVPGLRDVATERFFYNLDTVTIEKRISNGYYKRPKDFVADIKRLGKDAKTLEDQEKTIKANELLTIVEVEMQRLEHDNPGLTEACEQVYQREQDREVKRLEKVHTAKKQGEHVPQVTPNVPPADTSANTTEQSSGPVVLGERVSGRGHLPITNGTPSSVPSQWSNGIYRHAQYRDSNAPSNGSAGQGYHEDVQMSNDEGRHTPEHESHGSNGPHDTQTGRSQRSAITHMAHNSQPADYHNSASTTTSGQKTSDKSNRSSGQQANSQSTNGFAKSEHPDWGSHHPPSGGSQMPDTQGMSLSRNLR